MDVDNVNTYKVKGGWVVSENEMWLPGSYDSEQTARYAATMSDAVLRAVQPICWVDGGNRNITRADLDAAHALEQA